MDNNFVSNVGLRKTEDIIADQLIIDNATPEQHSIPRGVLDRLQDATQARTLDKLGWSNSGEGASLGKDIKIIDDRAEELRKGVRMASIKTIGAKRKMDDTARRVIKMQNPEPTEQEQAPQSINKIKIRLTELEELSGEIDTEISHIGAIIAIKDSYLNQLRVARDLMERADMDPSGDETLIAAARIIMHTVPKRYNTAATNANGRETIAQVIARLEEEVSDLNAKVAEERFEVGLEMALLNEIMVDPNIDTEALNNRADQAVTRYVEGLHDAGALVSMEDGTLEIIKRGVIKKIENYSGLASDDNLEEANVLNFTPKTLAVNTSEPLDAFDISSLPIDATSEILDELVDRGDDPEASYTFNPNKFKL